MKETIDVNVNYDIADEYIFHAVRQLNEFALSNKVVALTN